MKQPRSSSTTSPIRRASIEHHEPSDHATEPTSSILKVRQQSQSLRNEYSSSSSRSLEKSSSARSVGFDTVIVVKFSETVGRSVVPTTAGVPLALAWDEIGHEVKSVDDYETQKEDTGRFVLRIMTKEEREQRLWEEGFTSEEFRPVVQETEEIRSSREESARDPISELQMKLTEAKKQRAENMEKRKQRGFIGRLFRRGK